MARWACLDQGRGRSGGGSIPARNGTDGTEYHVERWSFASTPPTSYAPPPQGRIRPPHWRSPSSLGGFILPDRSDLSGPNLFRDVVTLVSTRYIDTLDVAEVYERAAVGAGGQLGDPYAELYSPDELEEFTMAYEGHYAGVGMLIESAGRLAGGAAGVPQHAGGAQRGADGGPAPEPSTGSRWRAGRWSGWRTR
jgi:hypothetical protein